MIIIRDVAGNDDDDDVYFIEITTYGSQKSISI
jgi:hypothetical protein